MSLAGKTILVTGGSRGLGLGIVEAMVDDGAKVTVVAREAATLDEVAARLPIATIAADITDQAAAMQILGDVRPDVLILNAGAVPRMAPFDRTSWEEFTAIWDTDVKGGLWWMQAALNLPLTPGSRVLVSSSGAAQQGSPMSGGYGGAKRMLWLMAKYANGVSAQKGLGISFQAIVPKQMVGGTGVGGAGSNAYAQASGITSEEFLTRFPSMPPRRFGDMVVEALNDAKLDSALAIGFNGETGIGVLEEQAA